MSNFEEMLKKSKRDISRNLYFSEYDAQSLYRMIQKYYLDNPYASNSELYMYFWDLFAMENRELVSLPSIRSDTLRYNICKYLLSNPEQIKRVCQKIHQEELAGILPEFNLNIGYSSNRESDMIRIVHESITVIRQQKESLPEDYRKNAKVFFNSSRSFQRGHKQTLSSAERKEFEELRDLFEGDEILQVTKFLKKNEGKLQHDLREDYINILIFLGKKFEKMCILSQNYKDQDNIFNRLGAPELCYPLDNDENDTISIKSLFTRETLDKLNTEQLSMLTAFWLNRYTKELDHLNRSFSIVNQLDLWDKIRETKPDQDTGFIHVPISEDDLEKIHEKMNFLHLASFEVFRSASSLKYGAKEIQDSSTNRILQVDVEPVLKRMNRQYGTEYREYFSKTQPDGDHDLFVDLDEFRVLENVISNTYRLKDMNLIAILSNLYQYDFSKNWGIMLQDGKAIDSSDKILIGVDVLGLNMPLRLHAKRKEVLEFLEQNQDITYMPIYEGENDFTVLGRNIGTSVLMPLCKRQKQGIIDLEAKQMPGTGKKRFFSHLAFLADKNKYPEHLKVEKVVSKKGKRKITKQIPPKRYIDLKSGEQFTFNNNQKVPLKVKSNERTRDDE